MFTQPFTSFVIYDALDTETGARQEGQEGEGPELPTACPLVNENESLAFPKLHSKLKKKNLPKNKLLGFQFSFSIFFFLEKSFFNDLEKLIVQCL